MVKYAYILKMCGNSFIPVGQTLNISRRHTYVPQRMQLTLYACDYMCKKYAIQDLQKDKYM